jgi:hypothetical protein
MKERKPWWHRWEWPEPKEIILVVIAVILNHLGG